MPMRMANWMNGSIRETHHFKEESPA